jgi:hypothetical protein
MFYQDFNSQRAFFFIATNDSIYAVPTQGGMGGDAMLVAFFFNITIQTSLPSKLTRNCQSDDLFQLRASIFLTQDEQFLSTPRRSILTIRRAVFVNSSAERFQLSDEQFLLTQDVFFFNYPTSSFCQLFSGAF